MLTIAEIRRENLLLLIKEYGSIAELNERLGWDRSDPRLSRIKNANVRADRGKPFQMGDGIARDIEGALALEHGWMDNVHLLVTEGAADNGLATAREPAPSYTTAPPSGHDYRTVAYSMAEALESSDTQVTVRQFLTMVDAAHRKLAQ